MRKSVSHILPRPSVELQLKFALPSKPYHATQGPQCHCTKIPADKPRQKQPIIKLAHFFSASFAMSHAMHTARGIDVDVAGNVLSLKNNSHQELFLSAFLPICQVPSHSFRRSMQSVSMSVALDSESTIAASHKSASLILSYLLTASALPCPVVRLSSRSRCMCHRACGSGRGVCTQTVCGW